MAKRFILLTNNGTTRPQDDVFRSWVNDKFTWWHWLGEAWLLVDYSGYQNVMSIQHQAIIAYPNVNFVVLEIPKGHTYWAGFGPQGGTPDTNMFQWITQFWIPAGN